VVRFSGFALGFVFVLAGFSPAGAEDLALPFSCRVERGEIRLESSHETTFHIAGKREEQIFTSCAGNSSSSCTSMMVHKFQMMCGSEAVSWARVAQAASGLAITLPRDLPAGFAPISSLGGRLILPAQGQASPLMTKVSSEALAPIEPPADAAQEPANTWTTTTLAEAKSDAQGGATRVGWGVAAVLMMMFAASLVASGRWRTLAYALEDWPGTRHDLGEWLAAFTQRVRTRAKRAASDFSNHAWRRPGPAESKKGGGAPQGLTGLIAMAEAWLANAETAIASLSLSLLLRDVLASELHRAHAKLTQVNRDSGRLDPDRATAIVRGLIREFDRIARIAESAAVSTNASGRDETRIPVTLSEAYEVLGLNANASPVAAKKLIDALRLSWHPDHATSEDDRRLREARMKQINAAWTIIQGRREAA
jgi:hypothetical protein